jgi:DNA-binding MarR family transcriptional regulator
VTDWSGQFTVARIQDGEAVWETVREASAREPIGPPVRVTPRQWRILRFLTEFQREHVGMPTFAQIAAGVGFETRSAVEYQLDQLEAQGLLWRARGRRGAIVLNTTL